MTINLCNNTSDNNVLSKNIAVVSSVSGSLKNESSVLRPTILIEASAGSFANVNYMYIPDFSRYYYITDIRSVRNNITEVSGRVDVLKTYDSQIRGCTGIIRRQEKQFNLLVNDSIFATYADDKIITKNFPSGFTGQSYVLLVSGK